MASAPESPQQAAVARAGRTGRRAGLAVYLSLLAYMVIVGFATFIAGVFFPRVPPDDGVACDQVRTELAVSLRAIAAATIAEADTSPASTSYVAWDERYEAHRRRCDDDARFRELETLRHRVETRMQRFTQETRTAFRRVLETHADAETSR